MFKYAIKRNKANIPLWVEINVLKTIENINKYILTILCFFDFKYYRRNLLINHTIGNT